jgi:hypothetical protein
MMSAAASNSIELYLLVHVEYGQQSVRALALVQIPAVLRSFGGTVVLT